MRLERGFRRIVIMLSILLFGLGIVFDVMTIRHHATVEVTLKDGRRFAVDRHAPKQYLTARDSLAYALKDGEGVYIPAPTGDFEKDFPPKSAVKGGLAQADKREPSSARVPPPPDWVSPEDAAAIVNVKYVHGPEYWWWTDSGVTQFTAGVVLLLWIMFYTIQTSETPKSNALAAWCPL